ncbi:MAG: hypothetical protein U0570_07925 [Phycisphaerales bacterium]
MIEWIRSLQRVLSRKPLKLALFIVALALFGGAIASALRGSREGFDAFARAREQPALLAALVVLPLVCLTLASMSIWVLTRRFGPVGPGEMLAILGAAWLLNYLPMKPGVAGRVAYQKSVHGIDVRWSVVVVVQSIVVGATCFAAQVLLSSLVAEKPWSEGVRAVAIASPVLAGVLLMLAPRSGATAHLWRYGAAFAFRYLDSLVWAVRYWILLRLAGQPQGVATSSAIAGISQSATLIPIAGNGLGVREWMVGLAASSLPAWYGKGPSLPLAYGVSAELLNRVCEVVVAVPVGVFCLLWLLKRFGRARALETVAIAESVRS